MGRTKDDRQERKKVVSDLEPVRTADKPNRRSSLSGSSRRIALGLAVLAAAVFVILMLDWSRMVDYVTFRQDAQLRTASNQAWTLFLWATAVLWWYSYLLRQDMGWNSWKVRLYWLTPLLLGAFYAGTLWASARLLLFNSELGREAIGATFGVGWPLLLLIVIGLEWSSRRN